MALKTTYKDDVFSGNRKYQMVDNGDGTTSPLDVTEYSQEGDYFGAADINATNAAINGLQTTVNGHTSSISSLSSTVNGHTTAISNLTTTVNTKADKSTAITGRLVGTVLYLTSGS